MFRTWDCVWIWVIAVGRGGRLCSLGFALSKDAKDEHLRLAQLVEQHEHLQVLLMQIELHARVHYVPTFLTWRRP
jgi:hypothetical protein